MPRPKKIKPEADTVAPLPLPGAPELTSPAWTALYQAVARKMKNDQALRDQHPIRQAEQWFQPLDRPLPIE